LRVVSSATGKDAGSEGRLLTKGSGIQLIGNEVVSDTFIDHSI